MPRFAKAALPALLVIAVSYSIGRTADPDSEEGSKPELAERLKGCWVLVGKPGDVTDPPTKGGRLKFYTGSQWTITQADPETGRVIFHHGGIYSLKGDQMLTTVKYANANNAGLNGKTLRFKVVVEGDSYTQFGLDNPYTEVWKRID